MSISSFFLCLLLFLPSFLAEDYYKLLNIKKSATDQEIKRAFKKLSLKYHPDKNRDNPDRAKEMFTKIANAYEILKDPETRRIYDQRGDEGVKQHQAQQAQGEAFQNMGGGFQGFQGFHGFHGGGGNFEDMFGSFFGGGGGGGGGYNFNFGGGGGGGRGREEPPANPFENTEVFVLNLGSLSKFFRRTEVWLILFFKGGERDIFGVFKELSEKYYGIFKVAAVNCGTEPELCEYEFDVRDLPTVLAY